MAILTLITPYRRSRRVVLVEVVDTIQVDKPIISRLSNADTGKTDRQGGLQYGIR